MVSFSLPLSLSQKIKKEKIYTAIVWSGTQVLKRTQLSGAHTVKSTGILFPEESLNER